MAAPMRIRAQSTGDTTTVRVLMGHPMESGQRTDAQGQPIPAWFIQEVAVALNGRPVLTAEWGPSVSKDPVLVFSLRGAKPGDRVGIRWLDNRGDVRTDEVLVL